MIRKVNLFKKIIGSVAAIILTFSLCSVAFAEEQSTAEEQPQVTESTAGETGASESLVEENSIAEGTEINLFEQIYGVMEANADKIFSILAFIGTLIVGVGYKSGFLPLLRDALSKLKSSIDSVKSDGELNKEITRRSMSELSEAISNINASIEQSNKELSRIEWQFENYDQLIRDRESLRTIISGQIDMLYAIFMSSALPQYQKDEIGEKIKEMREELASYENKSE